VIQLLKQIWNHEHLELQMDISDKRVSLHLKPTETALTDPNMVELKQADIIELISALLSVNRCFQDEKAFFED
jgi:hypothetical protein